MAVTEEQVRAHLEPEEPNYAAAAQLGPDALPVLEQLVRTADPLLASKAAYLASMIPDRRATKVLEAAAQSDEPTVRVAAAAGLQKMPAVGDDVAMDLIADEDPGVRKVALKSVRGKMTPELRARVEDRAASESDPTARSAYDAALGRREGSGTRDEAQSGGAAGVEPERKGKSGRGKSGAGAESSAPGEGGGDTGQGATRGAGLTDVGDEGGGGGDTGRGDESSGRTRTSGSAGEGGGDLGGSGGAPGEVTAHGGGQL